MDVKFDELASALAMPGFGVSGSALQVASAPAPFVPPVFQHVGGPSLGDGQVILIRASAAVGKSTLARALSSRRNVPILDLAKVPVATGSLIGILSHFRGSAQPLDAFHAGETPIIIDALDEGRLFSGDNGLLSFIETSGELILQDQASQRPKLVMLGRREAVEYANLYLTTVGVETTILDVGYFDETGARQLVHAYAASFAKPDSLYIIHQKPADQLITTYFAKIAAALDLPGEKLWTSTAGRSFAGYAPVLAAIGSILPEIDNFAEAQNRLSEVGTSSAWGVIETVLGSILLRDQGKVVNSLSSSGFKSSASEIFSPAEQKSLLLQRVQREPLRGTGRVRLEASDAAKYMDQVQRWLPEHPFLKDGTVFTNEVIASYVLAAAMLAGWRVTDTDLLKRLARQPFIWRSIKSSISAEVIIEGEFLGYILSSFWSDPLTVDETVVVRDLEGDSGSFVEILVRGDAVTFTATTPLHFYGQMRNVTVETKEDLSLVGLGDGATRSFTLEGANNIVGSIIDLRATELRIRNGSTWLDAEIIPYSGQLSLIIADGVLYGWSEKLASAYPFSGFANTLHARNADADDRLVAILSDCAAKCAGVTSITIYADYTVAENDYLQGVYARYGNSFSEMVGVLVDTGFAHATQIQASGPPKVRITLKVPFSNLRDAARSGTSDPELANLIEKLRARI